MTGDDADADDDDDADDADDDDPGVLDGDRGGRRRRSLCSRVAKVLSLLLFECHTGSKDQRTTLAVEDLGDGAVIQFCELLPFCAMTRSRMTHHRPQTSVQLVDMNVGE
jgi:hypothetical protein